MRCLYIDGQAGAAGDMILAAFLDLGADPARLEEALRPIIPVPCRLDVQQVNVNGIAARRLQVQVSEDHSHRSLAEVLALLERGNLSAGVKELSARVFRRLAEAEARVHSSTSERVHFHEVGANDAVADIVGAALSLEQLEIARVFCAPLVLGSGIGQSTHGPIHYPAPAVLEILRDKPVQIIAGIGETTTPTGAAILAETAEFTTDIALTPLRIGYGAGQRTLADRPNVLRATLGTVDEQFDTDLMWMVASDIDNTRPEVFDWLAERLRAAGAVDVTMTDIAMKKGRRGTRVEALCPQMQRVAVAEVILTETASLGVRWVPVTRKKLPRAVRAIDTPWGLIRVKIAGTPSGPRAVPEYDDCRAAAERSGEPLMTIFAAVERLFAEQQEETKRGQKG